MLNKFWPFYNHKRQVVNYNIHKDNKKTNVKTRYITFKTLNEEKI